MKQPKLNGLHLWSIKTEQNSSYSLWITTALRSDDAACRKARAFTRNEMGNKKLKVKILEFKYCGTIDA